MNKSTVLAMAGATAVMVSAGAQAGETLDAVLAKGFIQCGVSTGLPGFSNPDSEGNWSGMDVDVCRAVAAALFGDADAVQYTPLSAQQRFTALQSGEIDILSRNTTWTLTRDSSLGLNFGPTTFYDGQGFMVLVELGVESALELDGASVCVQSGTTTELNLADYFRANDMTFEPVVIESFDEVTGAYFAGRCDVFTTDTSQLASIRSSLAPTPTDHVILPEVISKEPLGPLVRHGDDEFFDVMKWVVFAVIEAEERGITSENVASIRDTTTDPGLRRLLGVDPGMGENLGLSEDWAYNAIALVGNYGEIFDRNVGPDTPLGLERGINAQWTEGGLIYAPPIR